MATKAKEPAEAQAANSGSEGGGLISNDKLRQMYATMLKCRTLEERARVLFKQGKFTGNYYAAVGQEATVVATAVDLRAEDTIGPSHRDFITGFVKGAPLDKMFCHLFARANSPDKGRSSPAHFGYAPLNIITPSSTIAAQLNIATGVALANKMKKNDNIAVAYFGDGSTSLGFWHEALNFAGVHDLPIIFVCQNNLWAESVNLKFQTRVEDLSVKAHSYGFPGITVDGNDVVAVYRVAQEAINRARRGHGPTLIECKTYRWYGHSEIDPAKYRDPEEVEHWKAKDPIANMEKYLTAKKLFTPEWKQEILDSFNSELDAAIETADKSAPPEGVEALDHVYSFEVRDRWLNPKTYSPSY
ncbi:thiamine pyrophosphate-dependent dehydrogenase E1 component subunit alpha [Acidicapsa dinghuensis]|uniref:2-oxoisovalerate dehydrogenase subunit alpha n=1 Tax=Acidicapsa dinghuensis TaxID=2218256 RepID=A0ABW1EM32_9BACT|nr:thiamine pyrophosphate-dependent dehydrogenase E1 component subunit alpha [Acidicapsa dinghuensis]